MNLSFFSQLPHIFLLNCYYESKKEFHSSLHLSFFVIQHLFKLIAFLFSLWLCNPQNTPFFLLFFISFLEKDISPSIL